MDLATIAGTLARLGAPILGGALGGPAGAAVASTIIDKLAGAFDVPATPDAVGEALARSEAAAVVKRVEATAGPDIMAELNAILADRQSARAATAAHVSAGSSLQWGAPVVSVVVLLGFALLSYMALYPPEGANTNVVLFLLGTWSAMATAVVGYWVGSSAGSKAKDETIASLRGAR